MCSVCTGPWLWRVCTVCLCVECTWRLGAHVCLCVCIFVQREHGAVWGAHTCVFSVSGSGVHMCVCVCGPALAVPEPPRRRQTVHTDGGTACCPRVPRGSSSVPSWSWLGPRQGDVHRSRGPCASRGADEPSRSRAGPTQGARRPRESSTQWETCCPSGRGGADAGWGSGLGAHPTQAGRASAACPHVGLVCP